MAKSFDSQLKAYAKGGAQRMKNDPTFPIYKLGYDQGLNETRSLVLDHLQKKYIDDNDRPQRNTDEAKYLLGLATELADMLRAASL